MLTIQHLAWVAAVWTGLTTIMLAADPAPSLKKTLPDTSDATHGLDLSKLKVETLYEADFQQPLKLVKEAELFDGDKRRPVPPGVDWVLEGEAEARIDDGKLVLQNQPGHLVFWQMKEFPADLLIEFAMSPADSNKGLAIVFLAARGRDGGGIFDASQPRRDGVFKNYHSRDLDCYHTSYWACGSTGEARGTAHIRKNHGFHIVSVGKDFIAGQGAGPHGVRILKLGPKLTVEVNGKIAVQWEDDAKFGPALGGGRVGLRQMGHADECRYTYFKVSKVSSK